MAQLSDSEPQEVKTISLASLARYRRALGDFVRELPMRLGADPVPEPGLRAIEGGLAAG